MLQIPPQRQVTIYWVAASCCLVDARLVKSIIKWKDSIGDTKLREKQTNGFPNRLNLRIVLIDESNFNVDLLPLNQALPLAPGLLNVKCAEYMRSIFRGP